MDVVDAIDSDLLESTPGQVIAGRFRLDAELGRGGYGEVWRARQLSVDRDVALKLLRADLKHRDDAARRFAREARLASRMRHPNAVTVIDFGDDAGTLFLAMELIDGPTLKEYLRGRGRLAWGEACGIVDRIAAALAEAHALGLVHRDLKPGNVLLRSVEGRLDPVVIDFGLAKVFDLDESDDAITRAHAMIGTPAYMSPEAVRGAVLEPRSDLYALGVILFELIAGRPPFKGSSPIETASRHLHLPAPSLSDAVPSVPSGVAALVADLLAKEPAGRPDDATRLRERIRALTQTSGPVVAPEPSDLTLPPMLRPAGQVERGALPNPDYGTALLGAGNRGAPPAPPRTPSARPVEVAAATPTTIPVATVAVPEGSARAAIVAPRADRPGPTTRRPGLLAVASTVVALAVAGTWGAARLRDDVTSSVGIAATVAEASGPQTPTAAGADRAAVEGTQTTAPAPVDAAHAPAGPSVVRSTGAAPAIPEAPPVVTGAGPDAEGSASARPPTPERTASGRRATESPAPSATGSDTQARDTDTRARRERSGDAPGPATGQLRVAVNGAATFRLDGREVLESDAVHTVAVGEHQIVCPDAETTETVSVAAEAIASARLDCRRSSAPTLGRTTP